jgi:hypothetical protein
MVLACEPPPLYVWDSHHITRTTQFQNRSLFKIRTEHKLVSKREKTKTCLPNIAHPKEKVNYNKDRE